VSHDSAAANTPEITDPTKDFRTKYVNQNALTRKLLAGFFGAVNACVSGRAIHSALEVGCGEGFSTMRLREMLPPGAHLRACDVEQHLVDQARQKNPGIPIDRESIYELPHADGSFDAVFVMEVLEHLEDPERGLAEVCRVSKRWVLVTVPHEPIWRMLNLARFRYISALGNTPGHLNHWSSRSFKKFVGRFADVRELRKPLPWTVILAEVRR
jgi:ubiquinone/menaquinone biosynthesis C-methylase UbiE